MAEPHGLVYLNHDVIDDIFHQSEYARLVGVNYATIFYVYGLSTCGDASWRVVIRYVEQKKKKNTLQQLDVHSFIHTYYINDGRQ